MYYWIRSSTSFTWRVIELSMFLQNLEFLKMFAFYVLNTRNFIFQCMDAWSMRNVFLFSKIFVIFSSQCFALLVLLLTLSSLREWWHFVEAVSALCVARITTLWTSVNPSATDVHSRWAPCLLDLMTLDNARIIRLWSWTRSYKSTSGQTAV